MKWFVLYMSIHLHNIVCSIWYCLSLFWLFCAVVLLFLLFDTHVMDGYDIFVSVVLKSLYCDLTTTGVFSFSISAKQMRKYYCLRVFIMRNSPSNAYMCNCIYVIID